VRDHNTPSSRGWDRINLWVFRGLIVFYVLGIIRIAFEVDWSKW
jgi:hypothetical protein